MWIEVWHTELNTEEEGGRKRGYYPSVKLILIIISLDES